MTTRGRCGRQPSPRTRSGPHTAVQTVRDRADTIEKYKDNIVALNESGTASMDADGVITLTLPDDAALPDDPTDFASWAQATIDANDLKSLAESSDMTATSPSGRTYDQVIDSIRANSTDSGGYDADHRAAYSDALITAIGPENLTSLPISAQQHFLYNPPTGKEVNTRPEAGGELASLLGTVLATASWSWSWDEVRSRKVADAIVSSVDEEGEYGRISALNAILGGHDADGNHVNDLTFGRRLLVDLAEGLDDIDYQKVARAASYPEQGGGRPHIAGRGPGARDDPGLQPERLLLRSPDRGAGRHGQQFLRGPGVPRAHDRGRRRGHQPRRRPVRTDMG